MRVVCAEMFNHSGKQLDIRLYHGMDDALDFAWKNISAVNKKVTREIFDKVYGGDWSQVSDGFWFKIVITGQPSGRTLSELKFTVKDVI